MTTARRLSHIFQDNGRTLIVALDHGLIDGPAPGLERPERVIEAIIAGGADAVLTSYGVATRFAHHLAPLGLILRLDGGGTKLGQMGPGSLFYSIEDALRLAADAVAVSAFPGSAGEEDTLRTLAQVVSAAHPWGMPVMAEMVPGGFDSEPRYRTTESIALSARVAAELGADWVKIPYVEGFQSVSETCFIRTVILGGAKKGDERTMLEAIRAACQHGSTGVAIGRNIFQARNPQAMTAAIAAVVHQDASVDEALTLL